MRGLGVGGGGRGGEPPTTRNTAALPHPGCHRRPCGSAAGCPSGPTRPWTRTARSWPGWTTLGTCLRPPATMAQQHRQEGPSFPTGAGAGRGGGGRARKCACATRTGVRLRVTVRASARAGASLQRAPDEVVGHLLGRGLVQLGRDVLHQVRHEITLKASEDRAGHLINTPHENQGFAGCMRVAAPHPTHALPYAHATATKPGTRVAAQRPPTFRPGGGAVRAGNAATAHTPLQAAETASAR